MPRERLPAPEADEFYHADLIGLPAVTAAGKRRSARSSRCPTTAPAISSKSRRRPAPPLLVPFTRAAVPEIDLAAGRVVVDPPAGLGDE